MIIKLTIRQVLFQFLVSLISLVSVLVVCHVYADFSGSLVYSICGAVWLPKMNKLIFLAA